MSPETFTLMQRMASEMGLDSRADLLHVLVWARAMKLWNCSREEVRTSVLGLDSKEESHG